MCGHHNRPSQAELRTGQRVVKKEGCLLELSSGPRIRDRAPPPRSSAPNPEDSGRSCLTSLD